jgi:leucyl aminopeptidase
MVGAGSRTTPEIERMRVLAEANTLVRTLTLLPPNELHPGAYRADLRRRAKAHGWRHREHDLAALQRMKAGAFLAVAQGSNPADAAIVHLSWKPKGARRRLALVGKGICFDTGGHNLKTARGMFGMHEDMNGSAVALAAMQAIVALQLPVEVHCLLAVAQNHLSPKAYKQNDVVTALNGTTIEIVHTDAEGRMVLADTLTLAAREQPDLIIDFATLTGSMITALGSLQSGVFSSRPSLEALARAASAASGERVVCFPAESDYDAALESKVADVRQCLQEGEADHILAARFLNRFRGDADWLHVDLSCYRHEGGLGAVASDVTGFGVAWTCALVEAWLAEPASPR